MSENTKRDRSPNFPKIPLEQAIELVSGLYKKTGKSQIRPEVCASALGYSGLNGAALTTIGALNQYGLLDRQRGEGIAVSQLAIKLIHPVNEAQKETSRREAVLSPRVFNELFTGGFNHCAEDVLANHLIQEGFTQDGARKAASVFKANIEFANLSDNSIKLDSDKETTQLEQAIETPVPNQPISKQSKQPVYFGNQITGEDNKNVLATYSIPLVESEASLVFTGEKLTPADFDALIEYVELFKKRFERKQKTELDSYSMPKPPFVAKIKTATGDQIVKIIAESDQGGIKFYHTDEGIKILATEVFPDISK